MNTYNLNFHHRRSIRLRGYDYSQKDLFFITLCVKTRVCLFGEIVCSKMILNDAGSMIEKWYAELENKFPDIRCHEYIIMPNHFHCIIENVGADLFVRPANVRGHNNSTGGHNNLEGGHDNLEGGHNNLEGGHDNLEGGHIGPPLQNPALDEHRGSALGSVLQWFKTMSTNEYIRKVKSDNWPWFEGKLWQRNYWEHIIRDEKSYIGIAEYIVTNPSNWDDDTINPKNKKIT